MTGIILWRLCKWVQYTIFKVSANALSNFTITDIDCSAEREEREESFKIKFYWFRNVHEGTHTDQRLTPELDEYLGVPERCFNRFFYSIDGFKRNKKYTS